MMVDKKMIMRMLVLLGLMFLASGCVLPEMSLSEEETLELVLITEDETSEAGTQSTRTSEVESGGSEASETSTLAESTEIVLEAYYGQAEGLDGDQLKAVLNDIVTEDHGALSYSQVYSALEDTDEDPNDPSKVLLFYKAIGVPDNYQRSSDDGDIWNREHVWAKSHGDFGTAKGPGTDLHMIRPTDASVNARRGHLDFDYSDNVFEEAPDTYVDKDSFEPRDEVKGDVARMLFYMAVRYEGEDGEVDLELSDRTDTFYSTEDGYGEHGKLSTLLEWHELDPVDDLERFRNDRIEMVQGNRNPFIDHPEFAELIWE